MTWRDSKGVVILCAGTVFFSIIVLFVVWLRPDDGQTFQTFTGLLTGFAGALLMRLKPETTTPPPGTTTTTSVSQRQTTETPQEPPKS